MIASSRSRNGAVDLSTTRLFFTVRNSRINNISRSDTETARHTEKAPCLIYKLHGRKWHETFVRLIRRKWN